MSTRPNDGSLEELYPWLRMLIYFESCVLWRTNVSLREHTNGNIDRIVKEYLYQVKCDTSEERKESPLHLEAFGGFSIPVPMFGKW